MSRLLLALGVLVLLALPAAAQTTSTSTSTTSTTTLVLSWACLRDANAIMQPGPYVGIGHCTPTGAYQSGGAALGAAATAASTAQALCGSGNQSIISVFTEPNTASGVPNALCSFSLTTFVYQCWTTNGTELSTSNVTPPPFNYVAYCK